MSENEKPNESFARKLDLSPGTLDAENWTVEMSLGTGVAVGRTARNGAEYLEVLSMEPEAVRTERLDRTGLLMMDHGWSVRDAIGRVVPGSVRVKNGQLLAKVRLFEQNKVAQGVARGDYPGVSMGYFVYDYISSLDENGQEIRTVTDWEPYEVSIVYAPADVTAGFRSLHATGVEKMEKTEATTAGVNIPMEQIDVEQVKRDAIQADLDRQRQVREIANAAGMPAEVVDEMSTDASVTVDVARKRALEHMIQVSKAAEINANHAIISRGSESWETETKKVLNAALDGRPVGRNSVMRQIHAQMKSAGIQTLGVDDRDLVRAAFGRSTLGTLTTSDFSVIFAGILGARLQADTEADETYNWWKDLGNQVNFSTTHTRPVASVSLLGELSEVTEAAPYKALTAEDSAEFVTPKKYGGLLVITEEMLINDELAAVPAMLRQLGDTIARTRSSAALRAFRGQMADGIDVFAAEHDNLVNSGTNITATVLNGMDSMLKAQKSRSGVIVGRPGTIALCGISAYERIRQIYTPITALLDPKDIAIVNLYGKNAIRYVPGLDDEEVILCTGKARGLEYGWLDRDGGAVIERYPEFINDTLSFKVRDWFGIGLTDYRQFVRNPGKGEG